MSLTDVLLHYKKWIGLTAISILALTGAYFVGTAVNADYRAEQERDAIVGSGGYTNPDDLTTPTPAPTATTVVEDWWPQIVVSDHSIGWCYNWEQVNFEDNGIQQVCAGVGHSQETIARWSRQLEESLTSKGIPFDKIRTNDSENLGIYLPNLNPSTIAAVNTVLEELNIPKYVPMPIQTVYTPAEYGGMHSRATGNANIYLTDPSDLAAAEDMFHKYASTLTIERTDRLLVYKADYSFTQLEEWEDLLRNLPSQFDLDSTDINHNRIVLYFHDLRLNQKQEIPKVLEELSIPKDAVVLREWEELVPYAINLNWTPVSVPTLPIQKYGE